MIKKSMIFVLQAVLLCLNAAAASAEDTGILGQPFPDFSVTDIDGNTFTLSDALQDHEAVLLNIWATWCPPCEAEMPFLNEVYEQYGDRVAFLALSCEADDTAEKIEGYRQAHGLAFPMGRDEGAALDQYIGAQGIPSTVIIDRFGNVAFVHTGSFFSADEVWRVLEAFLGDSYTETVTLAEIPKDSSTCAFPVSEVTAIFVENENVRPVIIREEGNPEPQAAYVVFDDTAHLRIEVAASDDPAEMTFFDYNRNCLYDLLDLLDPKRGAYLYDMPMPGAEETSPYAYVCVVGGGSDEGEILYGAYLVAGEENMEALMADLLSWGYAVSWEYGDPAPVKTAPPQAYVLHIVDQDGAPVPGTTVNFCTDTTCSTLKADENGVITFDGTPEVYHVQLLKAPEGYSFDPDFDMYTGNTYSEWVLRIRRD